MSPGVIIGVTSGVVVTLLCCIGTLVVAVVYFRERKQHAVWLVAYIKIRVVVIKKPNVINYRFSNTVICNCNFTS